MSHEKYFPKQSKCGLLQQHVYKTKQKNYDKNRIILHFCKSRLYLAAVFPCQPLHSVCCNVM